MDSAILLIRFGVSAVMIAFGIHQMIDPAPWIEEYMPKSLQKLPFMNPKTFMRIHSLGNMLLGILFLSGFVPQIGAYLTLFWWVSILPFAFKHSWHTGIRDLAITFSILALIFLL